MNKSSCFESLTFSQAIKFTEVNQKFFKQKKIKSRHVCSMAFDKYLFNNFAK